MGQEAFFFYIIYFRPILVPVHHEPSHFRLGFSSTVDVFSGCGRERRVHSQCEPAARLCGAVHGAESRHILAASLQLGWMYMKVSVHSSASLTSISMAHTDSPAGFFGAERLVVLFQSLLSLCGELEEGIRAVSLTLPLMDCTWTSQFIT